MPHESSPRQPASHTFGFAMCFLPQRRALFQYLSLMRSDTEALLTICVWNALGATMAYTIWMSTSKSDQKCSEHDVPCNLWLQNASRHNDVQFWISHLTWWLRTCHLREPTFQPSGPQKNWKPRLPFCAPASSFFWPFAFFDLLLPFSSLSDSSHLCFPMCPYCPKFGF